MTQGKYTVPHAAMVSRGYDLVPGKVFIHNKRRLPVYKRRKPCSKCVEYHRECLYQIQTYGRNTDTTKIPIFRCLSCKENRHNCTYRGYINLHATSSSPSSKRPSAPEGAPSSIPPPSKKAKIVANDTDNESLSADPDVHEGAQSNSVVAIPKRVELSDPMSGSNHNLTALETRVSGRNDQPSAKHDDVLALDAQLAAKKTELAVMEKKLALVMRAHEKEDAFARAKKRKREAEAKVAESRSELARAEQRKKEAEAKVAKSQSELARANFHLAALEENDDYDETL